MTPRVVELHIERLILHGYAHADRHDIAASLQRELGLLLADRMPRSLLHPSHIPSLDAGAFTAARDARPKHTGTQAARMIHGGLSR
ncbi:MAG TPA: hypothetical protein VGR24_07805 [bacterium]|jgi:hypothetical protein|nr:hypothetical protein [bacterium]